MEINTMTRDEAARHLAELHRNIDPAITAIYRVLSDQEESDAEPLKLLEINQDTFPTDEIWPLGFDGTAASGNYPTILMEITPQQFEDLRANRRRLPHEWKLGEEIRVLKL